MPVAFLAPRIFFDWAMHFLYFTVAVAGVKNGVELAVLVDASSLSQGGLEKSAPGRDIAVVTLIDSPLVGEHVEIVLLFRDVVVVSVDVLVK